MLTHTVTMQAVALQKLSHPYICGYREFFVIWDQEVTVLRCIFLIIYPKHFIFIITPLI